MMNMKMMNMTTNNLNSSNNVKVDLKHNNQNKSVNSDKTNTLDNLNFEDSLQQCLNTSTELIGIDSLKSIDILKNFDGSIDFKSGDSQKNEETKAIENIVCILSFLQYLNENNYNSNSINLEAVDISEGIEFTEFSKDDQLQLKDIFSDIVRENKVADLDVLQYDKNHFKNLESEKVSTQTQGLDVYGKDFDIKVNNSNQDFVKNPNNEKVGVSKDLLIQKPNIDKVLKSEVLKTKDKELISNIDKVLESDIFSIDSKDLIKSIKDELSYKLNNNIEKHEPIRNTSVLIPVNLTNKGFSSKSDDEVLKEISLGNEVDSNFDLYLRNDVTQMSFLEPEFIVKTIDFKDKDMNKFVNDFIDNIKFMKFENKEQMIIKLNPEHLGKMDIKFESVKENIKLLIRVQNSETMNLLESVVSDIKGLLKENHQINLENISVELNYSGFGSFDGQSDNEKHNRKNDKISKNNIKINDEDTIIDNISMQDGILV